MGRSQAYEGMIECKVIVGQCGHWDRYVLCLCLNFGWSSHNMPVVEINEAVEN
jgi:hypothetical protein